jgi:phage terminase large subunit
VPEYIQTSHVACCFCQKPLKRDRLNPDHPDLGWKPWLCWSPTCWTRAMEWGVAVLEGKTTRLLFGPTPKQVMFAEHTRRTTNTLFGGAKAVAKSYGLRWLAYNRCLRIPNLRVLLLRRTYGELEISHLLDMPLEAELLKPAGATYRSAAREMSFGNNALIRAGHCETDADVAKFLSSQWDIIIFDEIVTFSLQQFMAISSCARTAKPQVITDGGAQIWAATNPGGRGARWVKEFFVDKQVDTAEFPHYNPDHWGFVQGWLDDNPYMPPEYRQQLENLPPTMRRQFLYGDWDAFDGQFFHWESRKDGHPWHVADLGLVA